MTLNKKKFQTLASPHYEPDESAMQDIMREVAKDAMMRRVAADEQLIQLIGVNSKVTATTTKSFK